MEGGERHQAPLTDEGHYRLLVESITDYAVYTLDTDGIVTSWNRGAQRFKGYEPAEIIGHHFSRFYTDEDRAAGLPERALATAASQGRFEAEGWRVRKDGSRFWTHVVIDPIREESGELVGYAKITRDITERRDAQLRLDEAREALFQAQKLEAVGQLTGGIAHDFNNLLMVVLGSLELLRKRLPDDEKSIRLLDNALQGAERGVTLTQRMLAFARRQNLDRQPIHLPDLVRGMSDFLQRSLGPSVRIETRFPLGLPRAVTDPHQLETALLNLAVNARDAMREGGLVVIGAREHNVTTRNGSKMAPGRYVCLFVQDEGQGMDAETLARASEPFFTTKEVGKGTGLGLSMVQGLAEQSGGRLVLTSQERVGTTAEIWLPVAEADAVPADGGDDDARHSPARDRRPLAVLAVDDDALVLMNTAALLEDMGHKVFEATSARKALAILRDEAHIDLVISDHAMPQMTGVQLAGAIRAEWPDMPVILATGYAELPEETPSDLPRLAKPYTGKQLEDAIADAAGAVHAGGQVLELFPAHAPRS